MTERNDDAAARLVRIETRLVKYQEANTRQLQAMARTLDLLCEGLIALAQTIEQETHHG